MLVVVVRCLLRVVRCCELSIDVYRVSSCVAVVGYVRCVICGACFL